jgi:hypothetical protein
MQHTPGILRGLNLLLQFPNRVVLNQESGPPKLYMVVWLQKQTRFQFQQPNRQDTSSQKWQYLSEEHPREAKLNDL